MRLSDPSLLLIAAFWCGESIEVLARTGNPRTFDCWASFTRGGAMDATVVEDAVAPGRRSLQQSNGRLIPTLFSAEDVKYDRYAACLAATEGLRRLRDRQIAEEAKPDHVGQRRGSRKRRQEAKKMAVASYFRDSSSVVEAMGMPVVEFNEIGRVLCQDLTLKQTVLEQAYLYRIESSVTADRLPVTKSTPPFGSVSRSKVNEFCRSMIEIEALRTVQAERLKNTLQVGELPVGISDPVVLPLLIPTVRAVVEAFSVAAGKIAKKHGLEYDEFNNMLEQTKTNRLFRWKVQRQISSAIV